VLSIVDARSSRSSLEASILVILFCRFREKKTHVATTSGVCPTPPIDRFRSVPVAFEFTVDPRRSPFERVDFAIDF
jgi:hypothetical protein